MKNDLNPTINLIPKIIFKNDDYLIIDKPAGLLVHGAPHLTGPNLVDWLLKKYPKLKTVGDDPTRPAIVHRLDRDVSGLMVIPKNNLAWADLKTKFQNRTLLKEYTALVYGKIAKDELEIDFPLKRASAGFKMAAVPANFLTQKDVDQKNNEVINEEVDDEPVAKESNSKMEIVRRAQTQVTIIKRLINYTLLKVIIKTGRTHQIRVHLAAYGHPLVGDNLYGTKTTRIKNKKINLGRIFLAATRLEFTDLQGVRQKFEIELPPELKDFLAQAK